MADLTARNHNDRWLADLLEASDSPAFAHAVAALARASQANYTGDYQTALSESIAAARFFRMNASRSEDSGAGISTGSEAGLLRAQFERAYAEQLMRQTASCRRDATSALAKSERLPYSWLQIQLGLEKGVCSLLGADDWGADERISRRSAGLAQESHYDGLYLRAVFFVAEDEVRNGALSSGLKLTSVALERYWSSNAPPFRAYNLYHLLGSIPEFAATKPHLMVATWQEATRIADLLDDILSRAKAHSFAARAASEVEEPGTAAREYAEAARLLALAPRNDAVSSFVLGNEIWSADMEMGAGQLDSGIARLARIQDQIRPRSDQYLEEKFYATLGEMELRNHRALQAEQSFRPALESAEHRLGSLNSEADRISWSREASSLYLGMVEAELVQGHSQESLEYLEWYLGVASRSGKNGPPSAGPDPTWLSTRLPLLSHQTVLAYAALPDGLAIWIYDDRGVTAQWIPEANRALQALATRFYDLASNPRSETSALRRDARSLYKALIGPVETRLDASRTLVIEADGWPAQVPFEALLDTTGHYLVERTPIVHSLGLRADAFLREDEPVSPDSRALVVASEATSQAEGLVPLPDVMAEADDVAADFHSPILLKASSATPAAVQAELPGTAVLHFTGHSVARPGGAALLLEPSPRQKGVPALLTADQLRRLDLEKMQLAVLSTCNTETGNEGARGFNAVAAALQRAGVPHVVASRWTVDSVVTRTFVESFYRSAISGQSVSEAVRQAARGILANPRTAHPYYWSAFSAYGRP